MTFWPLTAGLCLTEVATKTGLTVYLHTFSLKSDGWVNDLRLYLLFNSISVISGRWVGACERLCAMEPS